MCANDEKNRNKIVNYRQLKRAAIFMRHDTPTNNPPRTANFDCELPDDARDELVASRRPRILGRPSNASDRRRVIVLAVLVLSLAAGVVAALWSWQRPSVMPAAHPVASPQPTTVTPAAPAAVSAWLAAAPTVRRAENRQAFFQPTWRGNLENLT
jgi:hypothetical protein